MPIPNLIRKTKRADDYKPVPISETDVEKHLETVPTTQNPTIHFRPPSLPSLLLAILVFSTTYLAILLVWPSSTAKPLPCNHIATRREWRTLSLAEKESYIKAVKCLKTRPSKLELNQTLYDDFPWVHSRVGERVHNAAPFLAWHRYFLHIYENALREECGYGGNLPYWNWALDNHSLPQSPIFSPTTGFGSNGTPSPPSPPILSGNCVKNGPFAYFEVPYLDRYYRPHCLSRGFLPEGEELRRQGEELSRERIEMLLQIKEYEGFNLGVEHGPHVAVPRFVRGDFGLLTAPSDPVFFLHHAQLDRLWWVWQNRDHGKRKMMYDGVVADGSEVRADVDDRLDMGGLAEGIVVRDVLDVEGGVLCYRY